MACLLFVHVLGAPPPNFNQHLNNADMIVIGELSALDEIDLTPFSKLWFLTLGMLESKSYCSGTIQVQLDLSNNGKTLGKTINIMIEHSAGTRSCSHLKVLSDRKPRLWFLVRIGRVWLLKDDAIRHAYTINAQVLSERKRLSEISTIGSKVAFLLLRSLVSDHQSRVITGFLISANQIRSSVGWRNYIESIAVMYEMSTQTERIYALQLAHRDGMCLTAGNVSSLDQRNHLEAEYVFFDEHYRNAFVQGALEMINGTTVEELESKLDPLPVVDTLVWFSCFSNDILSARAKVLLSSFYGLSQDEYRCIPCNP